MDLANQHDTEPALDAYSRVVTTVAAELAPHVAALEVSGPGGRGGAGSGVVVSDDGLLLTNAHVVARATAGRAGGSDGAEGGGGGRGPAVRPGRRPRPRGDPAAGGARRRGDPAGRPTGGRRRQPLRPG